MYFLLNIFTSDGKALVHSLQVNSKIPFDFSSGAVSNNTFTPALILFQVIYIHQLVQSRLMDNDRPLHDLYSCLRILSALVNICTGDEIWLE